MNRTLHLKETLVRNILDNSAYPNLEYVLLNYGSKDDMHAWVTGEMSQYLESGLLKYYKADFPEVFRMSHSKNMVFKLATGDILCSVDADNFTGPGFAAYINKLFARDKNMFLAPPWVGPDKKWWDVQGRLCLWKKDFYRFRGYDEGIVDYGYDDQDFKYRMIDGGRRKSIVRTSRFLRAIEHTDELRIAGGMTSKMLLTILLAPKTDREWEMLYLRTDNRFERFRVMARGIGFDKAQQPSCDVGGKLVLKLSDYATGNYNAHDAGIACSQDNGALLELLSRHHQQELVDGNGQVYYRLEPGRLQDQLLMGRACFMGKLKLLENKQHRTAINQQGFGQGAVTVHSSGRQLVL